jgi:hypothetical protein
MLRTFVCAVLGLVLVAGLGLAQDKQKKKGNAVKGTIKAIDEKASTITVTVKKKKELTDTTFKVNNDTKFVIVQGDDKKEVVGKSGLKNEIFKVGAAVSVTADGDKVAKVVQFGAKKKKKDK